MYYLDSLLDGKIYTSVKLSGTRRDDINSQKGSMIYYLGTGNENISSFLNSTIFVSKNFYNYYIDRKYVTVNKRVRSVISQKDKYAELRSSVKGRTLKTKPSIKDYDGYNLFIDLTYKMNLEQDSLNRKNAFTFLNTFVNTISRNVSNAPSEYDNFVVFFDLDTDIDPTVIFDTNLSKNPLSLFFLMLKKKLSFNFKGKPVTFVFGSPSKNTIYKLTVTDSDSWENIISNRSKIMSRVKNLINGDFSSENDSDSISSPLTDTNPSSGNLSGRINTNDLQRPVQQKVFGAASKTSRTIKDLTNDLQGTIEDEEESKETIVKSPKQIKHDRKTSDVLDTIKYTLLDPLMKDSDLDELRSVLDDVLKDNEYKNDSIESIMDKIEDDDRIRDSINKVLISNTIGMTNADKIMKYKKLLDTQDSALAKTNIVDTAILSEEKTIDRTYNDKIEAVNPEVSRNMTSTDFDNSYVNKQFNADILNVFKAFNEDPEIAVVIKDISIEDTSTIQTSKSTVKATLLDEDNVRHSVTLDIPTIYDGKYVKVNGSKKIITKQLLMLPIVKTKPTEVWVTSNYNKMIIERFGQKNSSLMAYLKKILNSADLNKYTPSSANLIIRYGNSLTVNQKYQETSVEYQDISKDIANLSFNGIFFNFNYKDLLMQIDSSPILKSFDLPSNTFPIGYSLDKKNLIIADTTNSKVSIITSNDEKLSSNDKTIAEELVMYLRNLLGDNISLIASDKVKSTDKLSYSRVKINNKRVPIMIILGYELGLVETLNKYGIKYIFTRTNEPIKVDEKKSKLKFKDGYLVYDSSKARNDLLIGGINVIDISNYNFADFNKKDPYLDYFANNFNSRNVVKGIHNTVTMFVDPITKEILSNLGMPENIYDIFLLANSMLDDLKSEQFNDISNYRMRGAEQVAGLTYKLLADAYLTYKNTKTNRFPTKISVPKDSLIKSVMELPTVDENSDLNPTLEIDKANSITYKGLIGRNSDESYTDEVRSYDKSMVGVLSIISPDSFKVGVVRQLSYDANVKGVRGFLDTNNPDNLSTGLYGPSELLNPFTSKHADSPRIGIDFLSPYVVIHM